MQVTVPPGVDRGDFRGCGGGKLGGGRRIGAFAFVAVGSNLGLDVKPFLGLGEEPTDVFVDVGDGLAEALRAAEVDLGLQFFAQRAEHVGSDDEVGQVVADDDDGRSITLTSDGSTNPLRQLARVVQITTESWSGVTSTGASAEWISEAAEVADASPALAQPTIPVHKADAFTPFSFEVEQDAVGFLDELSRLLRDAADQLTNTAYTTGSGNGQPTGLVTRLVAESGTVPLIPAKVAETFSAADIYAVQNDLGARFQPRASWCAALPTINVARQFESTNGSLMFPELTANPPRLLGRPMHENSNMDGVIDPAATDTNFPLVYGDFAAGMVIVDRYPSTIEIVPHLFGPAGRRPTGQRGALLWFRTGSDVVNANAFRLLSIPTSGS